jgi:hypothetical protein
MITAPESPKTAMAQDEQASLSNALTVNAVMVLSKLTGDAKDAHANPTGCLASSKCAPPFGTSGRSR